MRRQTGQFTEPQQERFRLIPSQFLYNPNGHDLSKWELSKYLLGNRLAKATFGTEHFDSISYGNVSQCPIKKTNHLHAIGHRKGGKDTTLVFDEIQASRYQDLFNHLNEEHGLILLESEMDEIIRKVKIIG